MRLAVSLLVVLGFVACSAAPPLILASPPSVDVASPLRGVPDPGVDPAVVLLDLGGGGACTGALLASDVVLTARRCIAPTSGGSGDSQCPEVGPDAASHRDLSTVHVLVGDDAASAVERARGRAVLVPPGSELCGADVAVLLLDATIDDVAPLVAHATGAAVGVHVRSVSYGGGHKLVRDHVPVTATSSSELALGEAPCDGAPGGPAIDEASGEVVGVLSRGGSACDDRQGYDVDTRADVFLALIDEGLAEGSLSHAAHQAKEKKGPVDLGASCSHGSDCAAGMCVAFAGSRYCTRSCSSEDRCPSGARCMGTQEDSTVCVEE
jgi:protease YdgD